MGTGNPISSPQPLLSTIFRPIKPPLIWPLKNSIVDTLYHVSRPLVRYLKALQPYQAYFDTVPAYSYLLGYPLSGVGFRSNVAGNIIVHA